MIKDGYFIDKDGSRYKILIDTYGVKYIKKNGRCFCI